MQFSQFTGDLRVHVYLLIRGEFRAGWCKYFDNLRQFESINYRDICARFERWSSSSVGHGNAANSHEWAQHVRTYYALQILRFICQNPDGLNKYFYP